jgi:signal peptidase I
MQIPFDSWPVKFAIVGGLIGLKLFVHLFSPVEADGQRSETSKSITETLDSAAIALGLVLFIIQPFLLQAFFIPSGSMEDTLRIGDRLLVSKLIYRLREPRFQDVVVFRAPESSGSGGQDFIKRCIGTPGHVVEVKNRQLYRDGKKIEEPYPKWSPQPDAPIYSYDMKIVDGKIYSREYIGPGQPGMWYQAPRLYEPDQDRISNAKAEKVPSSMLLMLGDHRNNSNDSHAWGFVPRENIVGKAIFVFWPPTRLGLVDHKSHDGPQTPNSKLVPVPGS